TKIMATLPSVLYLFEHKQLHIEDKVQNYFPEFTYPDIRIKHLLQHSSGLPAGLPYKNRSESRDVIREIMKTDLDYKTGSQTKYSDLGMILSGKIIEQVAGQRLDLFSKEYLFKPWKMHDTCFLPDKNKLDRIASTEQ